MAEEDRVRCDVAALPSSLIDRDSLYEAVIQQNPHQHSYTSVSDSARAPSSAQIDDSHHRQYAGMVEPRFSKKVDFSGTFTSSKNQYIGNRFNAERIDFGRHDHIGDNHHHHYAAPVERAETPPSPLSNVPFRPYADFINRGTILTEIERRCADGAARVTLVGIGGVGKSQLAIEYCHRLRKRSPDTWVFWVHASSVDRVAQGFREIAEEVKIPGRNDPQTSILELVKKWLRNEKKGKWLLVLDNIDNDTALILPQENEIANTPRMRGHQPRSLLDYLPQTQNGAVLLTTRTTSVAHQLVEPRDTIHIDPMTEAEAITLLLKKLNSHPDDGDLQDLVAVLEFMPLAIVQAAAYIAKRAPRCSVRGYR